MIYSKKFYQIKNKNIYNKYYKEYKYKEKNFQIQ